MNKKQLLSRYGLKWNPFHQDIPKDGMAIDDDLETFCYRVENLIMDGGFALISGSAGTGKSTAMRLLSQRLGKLEEIRVMALARPQSRLLDFYRELGEGFSVNLRPSNRWGGYRALRDKWNTHIATTLFRPVIFIDEAQETPTEVLNELRIISSDCFDSINIVTVILAGDERLTDRFRHSDLLPLGSRIKVRLNLVSKSRDELLEMLENLLAKAGNPSLMSKELKRILADKAMGNCRAMMIMAASLLQEAMQRDLAQLDEKLFFEHFKMSAKGTKRK